MAAKVKPYEAEEILNRPICPLTWLTNGERCVHCDYDCAWFNHEEGACGMLSLSMHMSQISKNLDVFAEYIHLRSLNI